MFSELVTLNLSPEGQGLKSDKRGKGCQVKGVAWVMEMREKQEGSFGNLGR